jgi:hypothetical protein
VGPEATATPSSSTTMCSLTGGAVPAPAVPSNGKSASKRKPVLPVHPSSTGVPLPPPSDDAEACARTVFFARVPPEILVEEILAVFLRAGPVTGISLFRPWVTSNNSKVGVTHGAVVPQCPNLAKLLAHTACPSCPHAWSAPRHCMHKEPLPIPPRQLWRGPGSQSPASHASVTHTRALPSPPALVALPAAPCPMHGLKQPPTITSNGQQLIIHLNL